MMSAARSKYAWIVLCLASIFILSKIEASALSKSPLRTPKSDAADIDLPNIDDDIDDTRKFMQDANQKQIFVRSADADDNYVDDDDDENKNKNQENKTDDESEHNENNQSPHPHGSHGPLGHVKFLLNHVEQGGGLHALGNSIGAGAHHNPLMPNNHHESAIETERDRTTTNTGTGLQVLEFLGTIFGLVWGFLSNIPALFGSSSAGLSGGRQ